GILTANHPRPDYSHAAGPLFQTQNRIAVVNRPPLKIKSRRPKGAGSRGDDDESSTVLLNLPAIFHTHRLSIFKKRTTGNIFHPITLKLVGDDVGFIRDDRHHA